MIGERQKTLSALGSALIIENTPKKKKISDKFQDAKVFKNVHTLTLLYKHEPHFCLSFILCRSSTSHSTTLH